MIGHKNMKKINHFPFLWFVVVIGLAFVLSQTPVGASVNKQVNETKSEPSVTKLSPIKTMSPPTTEADQSQNGSNYLDGSQYGRQTEPDSTDTGSINPSNPYNNNIELTQGDPNMAFNLYILGFVIIIFVTIILILLVCILPMIKILRSRVDEVIQYVKPQDDINQDFQYPQRTRNQPKSIDRADNYLYNRDQTDYRNNRDLEKEHNLYYPNQGQHPERTQNGGFRNNYPQQNNSVRSEQPKIITKQAFIDTYNMATKSGDVQEQFMSKFQPFRLGIPNDIVMERGRGEDYLVFEKQSNGDYLAIQLQQTNQFYVVPRFNLTLQDNLYTNGAVGTVFDCKGYDSRSRFNTIILEEPAVFTLKGSQYQLGIRGRLRVSQ